MKNPTKQDFERWFELLRIVQTDPTGFHGLKEYEDFDDLVDWIEFLTEESD